MALGANKGYYKSKDKGIAYNLKIHQNKMQDLMKKDKNLSLKEASTRAFRILTKEKKFK